MHVGFFGKSTIVSFGSQRVKIIGCLDIMMCGDLFALKQYSMKVLSILKTSITVVE